MSAMTATGGRILVIGEALVDLVITTEGTVSATTGGAPYNTARTCGRLGAEVSYAGAISQDRFGRSILNQLTKDQVGTELVQEVPMPTTLAAAELDHRGAATYHFYVQGTSAPAYQGGLVPDDVTMVFTGGLGLVLEPMADHVEAMLSALEPEVLVTVDVNCRPRVITDRDRFTERLHRVLARADVVKVSDEDLGYLFPGQPALDGAAALAAAGPSLVLLTAGADGVWWLRAHERGLVPVEPVEVVDTVGAGDAFAGGFISWWALGERTRTQLDDTAEVERAIRAANEVAGLTCMRRGADPPRRDQLGETWELVPGCP
jgi:fructokinase